jgi:hypothetical protein
MTPLLQQRSGAQHHDEDHRADRDVDGGAFCLCKSIVLFSCQGARWHPGHKTILLGRYVRRFPMHDPNDPNAFIGLLLIKNVWIFCYDIRSLSLLGRITCYMPIHALGTLRLTRNVPLVPIHAVDPPRRNRASTVSGRCIICASSRV